MLTFEYEAKDAKTGEKFKAEIQADSEKDAAKLITRQGLALLSIKPKTGSFGSISKIRHRIKGKDKILFSRQMATLINAGLPLVQSLRSVSKQTGSKQLQVVIHEVINDVEAGQSLSGAMSRHPTVFNNVYISLIAAGETSGTLDVALERIAYQQEKDADIISKVRGAMVYPLIVLAVMVVVIGFMIVKVLPQVQTLYAGLPGSNLPLPTRFLLAVSNFVISYWWLILILIFVGIFFGSRWARTLGGKRFVDRAKMRTWPLGKLYMKMYMSRFARTGTTLVATGVPLIQMLEVTGNAIDNVHIEESLKRATEKVKGGKSLSEALQGDPNFLDLVPDMLSIGEQSGAIEQMLAKIADYYEKEVDNQVKTISTTIEPVLMIVMGIFAFIVVAAVLLPIYGLAGQDVIR